MVNADQAHKRVRSYRVMDASVHDSQVFDVLLDQHTHEDDRKRPIYADSAYRSKAQEQRLAVDQIPNRICEKDARNHPLTEAQKASNHEKSKIRSRVSGTEGWTSRAHHRSGPSANENRHDESGVQQDALVAITQAR